MFQQSANFKETSEASSFRQNLYGLSCRFENDLKSAENELTKDLNKMKLEIETLLNEKNKKINDYENLS